MPPARFLNPMRTIRRTIEYKSFFCLTLRFTVHLLPSRTSPEETSYNTKVSIMLNVFCISTMIWANLGDCHFINHKHEKRLLKKKVNLLKGRSRLQSSGYKIKSKDIAVFKIKTWKTKRYLWKPKLRTL